MNSPNFRKVALILAIAIAVPMVSMADVPKIPAHPHWVLIQVGSNNVEYIDANSISRSASKDSDKTLAYAWVLINKPNIDIGSHSDTIRYYSFKSNSFRTVKVPHAKYQFESLINHESFNCDRTLEKGGSTYVFAGHMGSGKILQSTPAGAYPWIKVPGNDKSLYSIACQGFPYRYLPEKRPGMPLASHKLARGGS